MKKLLIGVVLFGVAWAAFGQDIEARFLETNGAVEIKEAGSAEWTTAVPGSVVNSNTTISTGIKSSAVLSLGSSRLTVSQLTMLTLEQLVQRDNSEDIGLYLRTGRVKADVNPPTGLEADFSLRSPTTTASVRGTSFEFDGRHLWVESGRVSLSANNGQKVFVRAGQHSYVDENHQMRIVPPFEAESELLRPDIPEIANTGSGAEPPQFGSRPGTRIIIDWPKP
ncbi:MAG: FecR family protein [Treponema sp.]|nr:FecR family protein [Treponema sp.]